MNQAITIGLDIAKHVFHAHGANERGGALFSKRLSRGKVLEFFAAKPPCVVALEACGGAHHWPRQLAALGGHEPFDTFTVPESGRNQQAVSTLPAD